MNVFRFLGLLSGFAVAPLLALAQNTASEADYQVLINGKPLPLTADKPITYKTPGGETLQLELRESAHRTFRDQWISFKTPRTVSVSKTALENDIQQVMAINALGSGLIVQEYSTLNPATIIDLFLQELTKDNIAAGGKRTDKPFSLRLADGKVLTGKMAEVKRKKETAVYQIATWSGDDEGLLIVLMDNRTGDSDDAANKKFLEDITGSLRVVR